MNEEAVKVGIDVGLTGDQNLDNLERKLTRLKSFNGKQVNSVEKDFKSLDQTIKVVDRSAKQLSINLSRISPASAAYNRVTQAATKLQIAQQKLNNQFAQAQQQSQKLNADSIKLAAAFDRATNAQKRADQESVRLANAQKRLQIQTDKLNSSLNQNGFERYRRDIDRTKKSIEQFGQGVTRAGVALTATVTAPIVGLGAATLKAGTDYDQALNIFQAVTKATAEEIKNAAKEAEKLGADITLPATSAKDAALAMSELGKSGFTAAQATEAARGALQLAAAGQLDEAKAAEIAANAINSFNLKAEDSVRVANLLAAASNASSAEVTDIAEAFAQGSSTFASAGIPIEDLTASIALLANSGIKGSDAGTSLKTFLTRLQAPTDEANEKIKALGVTIFDAQGQMLPFADIIGQFEKSLKDLNPQSRAIAVNTIFGSDAQRAANIIFGKGVGVFNDLRKAVTQQGAAADLAAAKTKGLGGAAAGALSQIETISIILYNVIKVPLEEFLRKIISGLETFTKYLTILAENNPQLVQLGIIFAGIAAAIGPILIILGSVISFITPLFTAISGVVTVLGSIGGTIIGLGGFIVNFIGLIGTAGLTASFTGLATVLGGSVSAALIAFSEILIPLAAGLAVVITIVAAFTAAIVATAYLIYRIWTKNIGGIQQLTAKAFNAVKDFIFSTFTQIQSKFNEVLPYLEALTNRVLGAIQAFWDLHGKDIVNTVTVMWNVIKTVITEGINIAFDIIKIVLQLINGEWKGAADTWAKVVDSGFKIISTIVGAGIRLILQFLRFLLKSILSFVIYFIDAGKRLALGLINAIVDFIKAAPQLVARAITYLVTEAVTDAAIAVIDAGAKLWGYVASGFYGGQAENPLVVTPPSIDTSGRDPIPTDELSLGDSVFVKKTPSLGSSGGGSGGGGRGSRGGRSRKEKVDYEPIDAKLRAQREYYSAITKLGIDYDRSELDRAKANIARVGQEASEIFQLKSIGITEYYRLERQLQKRAAEEEVKQLKANRERINDILLKVPIRGDKEDQKKRDDLEAQLFQNAQQETESRTRLYAAGIKSYNDETDAIFEVIDANRELRRTLAELTRDYNTIDQLDIQDPYLQAIEKNKIELDAAKKRLREVLSPPEGQEVNQFLVDRYKLLIDTLKANAGNLEALKAQKELAAEFEKTQRSLTDIEERRSKSNTELAIALEAQGASSEVIDAKLIENSKTFREELDKVIEDLEVLNKISKDPGIKQLLDGLKLSRNAEQNPSLDSQIDPLKNKFTQQEQERDRLIAKLQRDPTISDAEKQIRRNQIVDEYNQKLTRTLELWGELENKRLDGPSDSFIEAGDRLEDANIKLQSFSTQLSNTALNSAFSSLTGFFSDLASGAKSFSDAAIDAIGNFINSLAQLIIQIIALQAISAVTGIPVEVLAQLLGGGLGGFATGGAASTAPKFADGSPNGVLNGGRGGYIRGPGGPRSDTIPTYFPAAKTAAFTSPTEFILDAQTTKNIGVQKLNAILANKGRGFDAILGRRGFADGGAANTAVSQSVGQSINAFQMPEINTSSGDMTLNQLNYIGRKPIEEVYTDLAASSKGDKILVNQIDRNISVIRRKLGIK